MTFANRRHFDKAADEFVGKDPAVLSALILEEDKKAAEFWDAKQRWKASVAYDRAHAAQHRLAVDFGLSRGWQLSTSRFGLGVLSRGGVTNGRGVDALPCEYFDHSYCYRTNRRAAAIATHPYHVDKAACEAFAAENNLTVEFPDFPSWYYPGHTTLVLYIGPVGRGLAPLPLFPQNRDWRGRVVTGRFIER